MDVNSFRDVNMYLFLKLIIDPHGCKGWEMPQGINLIEVTCLTDNEPTYIIG